MTDHLPETPTGYDHSAAASDQGVDVSGSQNVVVTGDVHGNLTVTIGGHDVRAEELAYLGDLVTQYQYWAEKYTPLAGIAEVRAGAPQGPRLDLPMLFMPVGFEKLEKHGLDSDRRTERLPVDDLRAAVARYKRLVLLGEPGSGKTTTLWRLAYDYALAAQADVLAPLPLLVALGGYSGPEPALAFAQGQFGALGSGLPAYLRSGRVILLLDALNEMPQRGYKERVGRIQALLDQFPEAPAVVTCRALDYVETLRLEKLEVKPLDVGRQREYLQRYLGEVEGEKLFWQLCGGPETTALWRTWQEAGGTWEQFWTADAIPKSVAILSWSRDADLWRTMRKDGLPPLLALGRNSFMLVMAAQVYAARGGVLPQNRGRLFAAFVDTLVGREEKRCDPTSWPGADALRRGMAQLAYAMQEAGERGTAVDAAWAAQQMAQHGVDVQRVTHLCANATLLDLGDGTVRFVHRLMQEYFVALALVGRLDKGDDLRSYWRSDWMQPSGWEETFVLLAGMLPDMTTLVERLLPVNPPLAARCIGESGGDRPGETTIRTVQTRLVALATGKRVPLAQRNAAGDALNHVSDARPGVGLSADGLPDIVWCEVPAGEFIMGNTKATDEMAYDYEAPQSRVALDAYAVSQFPITNAQFEAFVADGGYTKKWRHCWTDAAWQEKGDRSWPERFGGVFDLPNHPVVMISWYEALAFCNWLSAKLGKHVALPTEAQWEKAARWTDGRRYPWGEKITSDHANYYETGIHATSAVGIFPTGESRHNSWDMSGNVWEWCLTKWRGNYLEQADDSVKGSAGRVVRGGSYIFNDEVVRCSFRLVRKPYSRYDDIGFRVCAVI